MIVTCRNKKGKKKIMKEEMSVGDPRSPVLISMMRIANNHDLSNFHMKTFHVNAFHETKFYVATFCMIILCVYTFYVTTFHIPAFHMDISILLLIYLEFII